MLNILTWKWKSDKPYRSKFGPETVNILKQCVKRHYKKPHRFVCITDDPKGLDPDIKVVPLWNLHGDIINPHGQENPSCYRRLRMFSPDAQKLFGKRFVSLDLDTVITGDLSPLWDRSEDIVLYGDTNPSTYYNGSMLLMTAGCRPQVWEDFNPKKSPLISKAAGQFGSDQGWISYKLGPGEKKWTADDGVISFRLHIRNLHGRRLPEKARVVMFHGECDPWSPLAQSLGWVKENWRYDAYASGDDIEAINVEKRIALLCNGKFINIIMLFDEDGEDTQDANEAVSFVAGYKGNFISELVSHFRRVRTN